MDQPSLPNWGPAQPMETAPRDGTRILVWAEVASGWYENAMIGPVVVRWVDQIGGLGWMLSPYAGPESYLDGEPTGWWPLPEQPR